MSEPQRLKSVNPPEDRTLAEACKRVAKKLDDGGFDPVEFSRPGTSDAVLKEYAAELKRIGYVVDDEHARP